MCVVFTATLYHVSVPVRTSWRYNLPGAALTLVIWIAGSWVLRWFLTASAGESTSIYGPLATPIAVMIWLYILAIAVLIGAALNASFDELWPEVGPARARIELMRRLRQRARLPRVDATRRSARHEDARTDGTAAEYDDARTSAPRRPSCSARRGRPDRRPCRRREMPVPGGPAATYIATVSAEKAGWTPRLVVSRPVGERDRAGWWPSRPGVVHRASAGGGGSAPASASALLARWRRIPRPARAVGDRVQLRSWADGPVTVERVLARAVATTRRTRRRDAAALTALRRLVRSRTF